jgi:hypothetical protein
MPEPRYFEDGNSSYVYCYGCDMEGWDIKEINHYDDCPVFLKEKEEAYIEENEQ